MDKSRKKEVTLFIAAVVLFSLIILISHFYYFIFLGGALWKIALMFLPLFVCISALAALLFLSDGKHVLTTKRFILRIALVDLIYFGTATVVIFTIQALLGATLAATIAGAICAAFDVTLAVLFTVNFFKHHSRAMAIATASSLSFVCVIYAVISFLSAVSSNIKWFSDKEVTFEPLSLEESAVSTAEKEECKAWFSENLLYAGSNGNAPAYDFRFGKRTLRETYKDWKYSVSPTECRYRNGTAWVISAVSETYGLAVAVDAVLYYENAACEWTVTLKNTAQGNSDKIKDFYALNMNFDIGGGDLYFNNGSKNSASDFALYKKELTSTEYELYCKDGRSSQEYLPYFNINGKKRSFTLGVGWSGTWETALKMTDDDTLRARVKQRTLDSYLLPGESIRSPQASLCFYSGNNALKGFLGFRKYVTDCIMPENITQFTTLAVGTPEHGLPYSAEELTKKLKEKGILENIDYYWYDAGWYSKNYEDWYWNVGSWTVDPSNFPNGLKEVSDYLHSQGRKMLLWYEPERLVSGSALSDVAAEHSQWLLPAKKGNNEVWNFANDEAAAYMTEFMTEQLKNNGVDIFRIDSNFSPDTFWSAADNRYYKGRSGITENHYVTNLYRFFDTLLAENEGLIIDNCASGGRRLDLEMVHRSVPLWRTDYNCSGKSDSSEAIQMQTYGLSFWIPYSNIGNYYENSEYEYRSIITPISEVYLPFVLDNTDSYKKFFAEYASIREYLVKDYYPLTKGSLDENIGFQFYDEEKEEGVLLIYFREGNEKEITVRLSGLSAQKRYRVYDVDGINAEIVASGSELMNGVTFAANETPKALIIRYEPAE